MENAIFYVLIIAALVVGYGLGRLSSKKDDVE